MSIGKQGEPCVVSEFATNREETACSMDKTETLICEGKGLNRHFGPGRPCRGPKACVSSSGDLSCDRVAAQVGDRCNTRQSSHRARSTDRKLLLKREREDHSPLGVHGGKFVT